MPDPLTEIQTLLNGIKALRGAHPSKRLNDSEISTTWLVQRNDESFTLRIDQPLAASLGLDRRSERDILKVVGDAGIGPELIWSDPDQGIQVCRYIPGQSWAREDTHHSALLTELARTLACLHQLPCVGRSFDPAEAAQSYADEIGTQLSQDLADQVSSLVRNLETESGFKALCHNDLVHSNLVGHSPVRLIDWEYAAAGDPCFDLATVIRHHDLPTSLVEILLNEYSRSAPAIDRKRLEKFCLMYDLLAFLWYYTMTERPGSSHLFRQELDRVRIRLKGVLPHPGV